MDINTLIAQKGVTKYRVAKQAGIPQTTMTGYAPARRKAKNHSGRRSEENKMSDKYELRLYDTPLISFEPKSDASVGHSIKITDACEPRGLFPLDLELTNDGVLKWLERRVIPKNRTFAEETVRSLGLTASDTKGIIDVCKGLSPGDSYWVTPEGFEGKFSEYNLYENRFSEILGLVAYTGVSASDAAFTASPELSANGMLPKAWRYIEGEGIYLYKGGTSEFANSGKEPYSEFYASQIAEAMGLCAVSCDLENRKGILSRK
jgi:hypothetical protein